MQQKILSYARQYDVVQNIMHQINEETLKQAYWRQPDSAVKTSYGGNLDDNIQRLVYKMKKFSFFPQKQSGKGESLEHEIRLFEDQIVECVFAEILRLIYDEKSPVIFLPKDGEMQLQNAKKQQPPYSYTWKVGLRVLNRPVDQKKLIAFLGRYIADKNFMKYLGRFLESGIMEKPIQSDAVWASDETLASTLMHIYCYHILREWLCSKGDNFQGKVHLCYYKGYFCFRAYRKKDLLKICNGLVDDQDKTNLQIVGNTYIHDLLGELKTVPCKNYFKLKK